MDKTAMFAQATSPGAKAYDTATTVNPEGHPAWERPLEERVAQLLLTNTLEPTFYVGAEELAKESDLAYREILAKDPEFFAKAIIHARTVGCMRLQPIVGLVYLSTAEDKAWFQLAFPRVILTPHDLQSFVEWSKKGGIRKGLGPTVKRAIGKWLNNLSEYHAVKYPLSGRGFTLRDIVRMNRPIPKDAKQDAILKWVVKGGDVDAEALPQIAAYESLKKAKTKQETCAILERGRIPHEVATGIVKLDVDVWGTIMRHMPHFALLRNLNTLDRSGVFSNPDNVRHAVSVLANEVAVKKARVLPFQYYSAYKTYAGGSADIRDAIVTALELSFQNLPELPGNIIIAPDVSGSMSNVLAPNTTTTYSDIASIFAAALFKKSPSCAMLPFGEAVVEDIRISRHDSIMTTAKALGNRNMGTDVGAPIKYANGRRIPMDTFIGVTDNVEWMTNQLGYGGQSHGFYGEWQMRSNRNAKAFLIRIDPAKQAVAPPSDSGVHLIYGWSASVLDYIALTIRGMGGQVKAIREVRLEAAPQLGSE